MPASNIPAPVPPGKHVGGLLSNLLGSLGVTPEETRNPVVSDAQSALLRLGATSARVTEFRFGRLIIEAEPGEAFRLRYDQQQLQQELRAAHPTVTEVVVRAARS
jgi:maltodextrin utilization protein YvdJ